MGYDFFMTMYLPALGCVGLGVAAIMIWVMTR